MEKITPGKLFLIPTPLGNTDPMVHLPKETLDRIHTLKHFIVEEQKSARRFLVKTGFSGNLDESTFLVFNEHSDPSFLIPFLQPLLDGENLGLMSEAGVPCVADPGSIIVSAAHQHGIQVIPLIGPSSILLALMASGFNGQQYAFHGYLPIDRKQRQQKIRDIERNALAYDQTQIFIETPYRNNAMLESLVSTCKPSSMICVAMALTTDDEQVTVRSVSDWKNARVKLEKRPAVFLLYHFT